jgi:hypothetical protein
MDEVTIRLLERVIITLGGILSIYLGYRLFHISQLNSDSTGTFKVKEVVDIGLNRVGPGIFFALFGAFILHTSLSRPISIQWRPEAIASAPNKSVVYGQSYLKGNIEASLAKIEEFAKTLPVTQRDTLLGEIKSIRLQVATYPYYNFIGKVPSQDEMLKQFPGFPQSLWKNG